MTVPSRETAGRTTTEPGDGLIIQLSRHEPQQFGTLFRRHATEIKRYVVRRLGADVADDVVADTFLQAFMRRDRYDPDRADARPWLYGIATNLIGCHRRKEIRQYHALARTRTDPVMEPFTDRVDARVSAASATRRLAAVLAKLPASHRDTLLLVAWGDLSYEEAATALGVPVGTVRSRLHRARSALKRTLDGSDQSPLHSQNHDSAVFQEYDNE